MEKKKEDDSNGDEDGDDQSFRQGNPRGFEESASERPKICCTDFRSGFTTILRHGEKKRKSDLMELTAGIAQG